MSQKPAAPSWWRERSEDIGAALSLEVTLLHREQSPYQLIEILDHKAYGRLLVLDGYVQASQADEFIYHEMALHVPLLGRERTNTSVLILGGGDGGALREALVHDFVTDVTMVEIDERVIALSNEYLGVNGNYNDPRVTLHIENAADVVARYVAEGKKYDLILLDLTEPVGPSACLFTEDFCRELVKLVSDTGVIIDSDSIFLSTSGGQFLQEDSDHGENLVNVMRRTKMLPHMEVYRGKVPVYPGADFGFYLYSRDGVSLKQPVRNYEGKQYSPEMHSAAFVLPRWQKEWLGL
ncbi:spermine/spermidine synthase domain-containing protein [Kordiimonas pumila]|uniref:Polyamine aminopropyltransferase n=1 Tax=Kordiimonas pumila TaxID=2161677 RepID=A0ABV7D799_9PROT|nr:polyamine aminopropyltransferase [Kordiimonas pumila]